MESITFRFHVKLGECKHADALLYFHSFSLPKTNVSRPEDMVPKGDYKNKAKLSKTKHDNGTNTPSFHTRYPMVVVVHG